MLVWSIANAGLEHIFTKHHLKQAFTVCGTVASGMLSRHIAYPYVGSYTYAWEGHTHMLGRVIHICLGVSYTYARRFS